MTNWCIYFFVFCDAMVYGLNRKKKTEDKRLILLCTTLGTLFLLMQFIDENYFILVLHTLWELVLCTRVRQNFFSQGYAPSIVSERHGCVHAKKRVNHTGVLLLQLFHIEEAGWDCSLSSSIITAIVTTLQSAKPLMIVKELVEGERTIFVHTRQQGDTGFAGWDGVRLGLTALGNYLYLFVGGCLLLQNLI